MDNPLSRRDFLASLTRASLAAPLLAGHPSSSLAAVVEGPAPPPLKLGVVGLGEQGGFLARRFSEVGGVVSLCDVHQGHLKTAAVGAPGARVFRDYRELLALSELDGVVIATPDHWHTLMTIEALAAGKHVYLETPVCRSLAECRALRNALRLHKGVVQVAVMGRANAAALGVQRFLADGKVGAVSHIELWSNPADAEPHVCECSSAPDELNWDLWLGPARERDHCESLVAGGWRWDADLGGGIYRQRAFNHLALLPWLAGISLEGRWSVRPLFNADPDAERRPENLLFEPEAGAVSIHWQQTEEELHPLKWGLTVTGTEDSVWLAGGDARCSAETKVFHEKPDGAAMRGFDPNHRGNWINAIRGNSTATMPLSDALPTMALTLAGETAARLGRKVTLDLDELRLENEGVDPGVEQEYRAPWRLPT